ncbi:MAG TPA: hypothetical protein VGJ41_08940 [Nocardioides sp.]
MTSTQADRRTTAVPASLVAGSVTVEIACDESGSEGEKLVGGSTDVFAHASVDLSLEAARDCIEMVRIGARSPATECKASVVLRERNRRVLVWLIGPDGPLHGRAHVHLTEKSFRLTAKLVELLGGGVDPRELYDAAPHALGARDWTRLLAAFNDLMRSRDLLEARMTANRFFDLVEAHRSARGSVGAAMSDLWDARPDDDAAVRHLLDRGDGRSVLDPLVPAIARGVLHWYDGARPVSLVHDEQGALTPDRLRQLDTVCGDSALAGIRFVDSTTDPRVQVADLLAGAARKIASDQLNRRGDVLLTALLRPYLDRHSAWGDPRSWRLLAPAA